MSWSEVINKLKRWQPAARRDWVMTAIGALVTLAAVGVVMLAGKEPEPAPLAAAEQPAIDIPWLPDTVRRWEGIINEMAAKYNIDPEAAAIIMTLESGGYSKARSEADALGLMQVTPPTAQDISRRYLKEPRAEYDLLDPRTNIEFGMAYLAHLRDEFGEPLHGPSWDYTVELIAAGYNAGPGNAGRLYRGEGLPSQESVSYSRDALGMWRERKAEESSTFNRWLERGGFRLVDRAKAEQNSGG